MTERPQPFARKRFGQHFLEPEWVRKVVEAFEPAATDTVIEIGPGRGALTRVLAPLVERLVAVEIDRDLASGLQPSLPANASLVVADILDVDLHAALPDSPAPVRVIGNLPYYISSPILFRLLAACDEGAFLSDATLMVQQEVAARLAAHPGSRDYGVLSILVQLRADVRQVLALPPGAFRPAPKVHSAVVRLTFRPSPVRLAAPELFEAMVKALFGQRRKTAGNALKGFAGSRGRSAVEALVLAGIDPTRRPETLELPELAALAEVFASARPS